MPFSSSQNSSISSSSFLNPVAIARRQIAVTTQKEGAVNNIEISSDHQQLDPHKVSSLLKFCIGNRSIIEGKLVHDHIIKHGLDTDTRLHCLLLSMYSTCEAAEEAFLLLDLLPERNVFLWNFVIRTFSQKKKIHEVLHFCRKMQHEGCFPDKYTVIHIVSLCQYDAGLQEGIRMHACLWSTGLESEAMVGSALLNMYGKNGYLKHAKIAFERVSKRDIVLCTAMIGVYAKHENLIEALQVFDEMQCEGMKPNKVTFLCLFDACAVCEALREGMVLHHCFMDVVDKQELSIGNVLINLYGKCGSLEDSFGVFDRMADHNEVTWCTLLSVYVHNHQYEDTLCLYNDIHQQGMKQNRAMLVVVLEACAMYKPEFEGQHVHACIVEDGWDLDRIVATAVVNFYCKLGKMQDAEKVFSGISLKDTVAWNAMIAGYANNGNLAGALQLFDLMQLREVKPNSSTCVSILDACGRSMEIAKGERMHAYIVDNKVEQATILKNALINMYGKFGWVETARSIFNSLIDRSIISWNVMISIYGQEGHFQEAFTLFHQMQSRGVKPDRLTLVGMLNVCVNSVVLDEGMKVHTLVVDACLELDTITHGLLLDMYGRSGSLEDAWSLFERSPDHESVVSVSAMMALFAKHGQSARVFRLLVFMDQKGLKPNNVTFINILTACNHDGLFREACLWLSCMWKDYQVMLEIAHLVCLIDLLGRVGSRDEAEGLIRIMPFQPEHVASIALLGACRELMDMDRADDMASYLMELKPDSCSPYVILSNIYASTQRGCLAES